MEVSLITGGCSNVGITYTRDLFMLCMCMCSCASYIMQYLLLFFCFCFLFDFSFVFCSTFVFIQFLYFFIVHCSLFKEKSFNSDPGLYSRYFDPTVPLYKKYRHHLCMSINIIHQTALTLSQYRREWPITNIDIAGYTKPIFSKL